MLISYYRYLFFLVFMCVAGITLLGITNLFTKRGIFLQLLAHLFLIIIIIVIIIIIIEI